MRIDRCRSICNHPSVSDLPDSATLVDLHLENLCDLDDRGRLLAVNDGTGRQPPWFSMVLTAVGHRWFVRHDLDDALAGKLGRVAAAEPVGDGIPEWPRHREAYRELLGAARPVEEYCGPAFVLPEVSAEHGPALELSTADRPLLDRHFPGWARDFEPSRPFGAVIEDGAVVSVCGNARRKTRATEAGVETAEAYRGRGYARAVTAVWASALRREGIVPLYSTSWDNAASRRVAGALGAVQYAVDFNLT